MNNNAKKWFYRPEIFNPERHKAANIKEIKWHETAVTKLTEDELAKKINEWHEYIYGSSKGRDKMKIVIVSKEDCKPCEQVKQILLKEGYPFATLKFESYKREVAGFCRANEIKGFPLVFINGVYAGAGLPAVHAVDAKINLADHLKGERGK